MGQDKCAYCNCQTFDKNPFSPGKCATCLHNHVKPAGSSSPAGSPALKSVSTPNNITKPQNNNNSNSQLKNNTTVPTTPAKKKPPPVPASVSSPNLKDDKAPSAPPKPQRFASTDNYKVNSGPTNNNNNNTNNNNPAVPAKPNKTTGPPVPSNRPTGPKVNTTISNSGNAPNSPSLNSISTPASPSVRGAMSSEKKKESFFSSFKKFITGDDEENAPAVLEIGSPVFVKHTTHIGITDKGFETRNLPPDMKKIFEDLDKTLKSMGAKKLTKKEAQFVLNTLLAAMPPNGSTTTKPANMPAAVTPGTPQQKPAPAPSIAERTQAYNNAAKTTPATSVTSPTLQSTTNYSANPPRPRIEKPLPSVAQAENKELAKLREQVKNLELEVNRYKDQVNTQRSQLKGLESDRIAASKASDLASDQQKRLERLEKENKELQDNIRQTQDAARGESKGKNDMEKQIILLQNEVREAQNKGKTAETNIINEEKKRKAVEDELNKTKDRLEALKGVEEARTKLEHEIERLKLQQAQQGANSSSISEKLTASFEQEIKELKALAAKDLDEATKKYKDIDAEVKKLSQQVQDKNKEKNEFETTISNLKAEKAVSAKDASAAIEEINRLKSQLDQIKNETGKRAAEEKTIQELRDKNRDLEYTKKELESKAQFFENERSDFERERNAWANERKDKDTERREIEGERRERDAEREEWERERESYEEERRKWEIEKRNILNEVEKARSSAGSSAEVTSPPSSIPASIPAPPPPPPPMMPSFDKKPLSISSSPKISQPPAAPDNRDALLEAIRNPGKQLKHRESLIVPKDIDLSTQDPTNIVGILARALIDRRADIGEEEDEEDNESWDE